MVNTVSGPMGTIADATNVLNGTGAGYTITTDKSSNYSQVNLAGGAILPATTSFPKRRNQRGCGRQKLLRRCA